VAEIAADAGVSPQTIYAVFGGKTALVVAMLEELEEPAVRRGVVAEILAEPHPGRQLRMLIRSNRSMFERGSPILRAAMAARGDPDVAAMARRGDVGRKNGALELTRLWAEQGALAPGLDPRDAADQLWLLTSVEQFLLATDELGWSGDRYEQWLGDLLERTLLADRPP